MAILIWILSSLAEVKSSIWIETWSESGIWTQRKTWTLISGQSETLNWSGIWCGTGTWSDCNGIGYVTLTGSCFWTDCVVFVLG